jgi:hypothetical protein
VTSYPGDVTIEAEIADLQMGRPHVLLLGAGASKAALPDGDQHGQPVPLMRDLSKTLQLTHLFPTDLRGLASSDFEGAYSHLFQRNDPAIAELDKLISEYFGSLRLPDSPTLYDYILLSMRTKDAVFTFNWDSLLVQARIRLTSLGVTRLPKLFFLHGNVAIGYCAEDQISGVTNRGGFRGQLCSQCGRPFAPSRLLFPVAQKDYQVDPFTIREWSAARFYLENCFMLSVFGYSAPKTDVEAVDLLKEAWATSIPDSWSKLRLLAGPDQIMNCFELHGIHSFILITTTSSTRSSIRGLPTILGEPVKPIGTNSLMLSSSPTTRYPRAFRTSPTLLTGSHHCWRSRLPLTPRHLSFEWWSRTRL